MRKIVLVSLIAVNVALGAALAAELLGPRDAFAQAIGLSGNYIMVSGSIIGTASDVVYVVDLEARELLAIMYDPGRGGLFIMGRRDLSRDLGVQTGTGRTGERGRRRY